MTKISDFSSVTAALRTDQIVLARSGSTKSITAESLGIVDTIIDQFGTPNTTFEFATNSLTGLTALSNTPDFEDADTTIRGHYYVRDNAGGSALVGRYATTPATPFTAFASAYHGLRTNNTQVGLFVGEATPGVMETIGVNFSSGLLYQAMIRWTNPTTFGSTPFSLISGPGPVIYAIRVNSTTNIDFLFSYDGLVWTPLIIARDPSITVGSVGVFLLAAGTDQAGSFDYMRIYNSALSLKGL